MDWVTTYRAIYNAYCMGEITQLEFKMAMWDLYYGKIVGGVH